MCECGNGVNRLVGPNLWKIEDKNEGLPTLNQIFLLIEGHAQEQRRKSVPRKPAGSRGLGIRSSAVANGFFRQDCLLAHAVRNLGHFSFVRADR